MRGCLFVACAWLGVVGCRAAPGEALAVARDRPADPTAGPAVESTVESVDPQSLMQSVESAGVICTPVSEPTSSEPSITTDWSSRSTAEDHGASTPEPAPASPGEAQPDQAPATRSPLPLNTPPERTVPLDKPAPAPPEKAPPAAVPENAPLPGPLPEPLEVRPPRG